MLFRVWYCLLEDWVIKEIINVKRVDELLNFVELNLIIIKF